MKRQLSNMLILTALCVHAPLISAAPNNADTPTPMASSQITQKIDLNTASVAELQTLPGVGISKAEAIISYRQNVGPFLEVAQITEVKGIGEKMLSKLETYVVVRD